MWLCQDVLQDPAQRRAYDRVHAETELQFCRVAAGKCRGEFCSADACGGDPWRFFGGVCPRECWAVPRAHAGSQRGPSRSSRGQQCCSDSWAPQGGAFRPLAGGITAQIFLGKKNGFAKLAHQRPRHGRPRKRSKRQDHEQQAEEHHRLEEEKKRESRSFQINKATPTKRARPRLICRGTA